MFTTINACIALEGLYLTNSMLRIGSYKDYIFLVFAAAYVK